MASSIDSDDARLELLLSGLPSAELEAIVGRRRFAPLNRLVTGESASTSLTDEQLARYAVALDGHRLLARAEVLAALLMRLPAKDLRAMATRHLERPFSRDADNAMALASKQLRIGSPLTLDVLAALGLTGIGLEEAERKNTVETIEPYEPLPPLLDFQGDVRRRCLGLFAEGARELLIQMPTGSGKTRTAMELVVDLVERDALFFNGHSVVWLAHTEELCEQAIDSFSSVWATRGAESAKVVRLWATYSPSQGQLSGALVVAGTARLHSFRKNDRDGFEMLARLARIVIVDEAHRALAPTVRAQIMALRQSDGGLLIGLSATPARSTDPSSENTALAGFFGRRLVSPELGDDPIEELRRRGILAKLERVELSYSGATDALGDVETERGDEDEDFPEAVLASLEANTARNSAIIETLEQRVTPTKPAIVFCCSVAHAELLAAALRLRGVRAASVDCRMRRGARRSVIRQFSKGEIDVLLNFGVLSTGFDAPNVRTVVIARPTKSMILYSQMLGRGLRGPTMGGTDECTLIDVRDHLGRFGDLSALYLRFKPYWME